MNLLTFCIHCFCLVGCGISSTNAEVVSSFFELKREKDVEKGNFEVASFKKDSQTLNCVRSCMQEPSCSLSSFGQDIGCLLSRKKNSDKSPGIADIRLLNPGLNHFKKIGEFDPEKKRFISSDDPIAPGSGARAASSCADIKNKTNGIYNIKLADDRVVQVYCIMDNIPGCGLGGWALAVKIDGLKSTFSYESSYWTDKQTLNFPENSAALDDKQMKSPIFWEMKARKICVGMKYGNTTNWLQMEHDDSSLRYLFENSSNFGTDLGKSSWKSLIGGSSILEDCTLEGFNIISGKPGSVLKIRIGMLGSGTSCASPSSFIGFGSNILTSSGNVILRQHDTSTFGYILLK